MSAVSFAPTPARASTPADTLGSVLNTAFTVLALATAALLAARLVRRGFRLAIAHGS